MMLVFGDRVRTRDPRRVIGELARAVAAIRWQHGIARHAALVGVFIEASELAQGLADAELAARGCDARGATSDAAMAVLVALAKEISASWNGERTAPRIALDTLLTRALPDTVDLRRAEGYAFYAVYPEAYLVAARTAVATDPGPRRVIGIRSIGTGLAAMVGHATGAPLPATVRPSGHPFHRELVADDSLIAEWDPAMTLAIVDEGPGLSGSSFGAVADALEDRGITRIECYPSHGGAPGPAASIRHRERWRRIPRHVASTELVLDRLASWVTEVIGPLEGPLEDISAGAWRSRRYTRESEWPPAVTYQERRKLLARADGAVWLARFVGLGRHGEHAHARARTLYAAGFTPEVAGLCHGFLVERWRDDARILDPRLAKREHLVEHVGRYLAFRAHAFPAEPATGASLAVLGEMIRRNATLALGGDVTTWLDRSVAGFQWLEEHVERIEIDGRLHAWEWLVIGDRLLKADAYDHHAAHDLVGCQDLTWDFAGAELELGLSRAESARLAAVLASHGLRPHPELLSFMRLAYIAFQLGRHALAIDAIGGTEAGRLRAASDRYAARLQAALADTYAYSAVSSHPCSPS
jgi:hypothetical protein